MNREDKARLYDEYIRESDYLLREISKIKSEFVFDIPKDKQDIIDRNNSRILVLENNLKKLFID